MENKILDTNILVRLFMQDNQAQYERALEILNNADIKAYKLYIPVEVVIEFEYVLRKVYSVERSEIAKDLESIVQTSCIDFIDSKDIKLAIALYPLLNTDLVDLILFARSKNLKIGIESFDKDFKKIQKAYESISNSLCT